MSKKHGNPPLQDVSGTWYGQDPYDDLVATGRAAAAGLYDGLFDKEERKGSKKKEETPEAKGISAERSQAIANMRKNSAKQQPQKPPARKPPKRANK